MADGDENRKMMTILKCLRTTLSHANNGAITRPRGVHQDWNEWIPNTIYVYTQREFSSRHSSELMVKIINVFKQSQPLARAQPVDRTHTSPWAIVLSVSWEGVCRVHLLDFEWCGTGVKIPMDYLVFLMWFNNSKLRVLFRKNSCAIEFWKRERKQVHQRRYAVSSF